MRLISKRTDPIGWNRAGMSAILWVFVITGLAQDPSPPPAPAAAGIPVSPEAVPAVKSTIQTPALDFLLNKVPSEGQRPSNVTIAELPGLSGAEQEALKEKIRSLNGLTSPGFDNPIVRARYEKFLSASAANPKDVARYSSIVRKVQEALLKKDDRAAWKLLFELSRFEWDAGIGEALAARVEATWDMKLSNAELENKISRLQQEVQSANWNTDVMTDTKSLTSTEQPRSVPANRQPQNNSGNLPAVTADNVPFAGGKMRAISEYLKVVEGRTKIKAAEIKSDVVELKNKTDFQEYVGSLFTARRHLHAILAADFYRALYGGGDYPPTMANQVNASKEILRDVDQAVQVFHNKLRRQELAGASEHLQNAFMASEFHTALLSLDLESKLKVQSLGFDLVKLQTMLEARDFGNVDPLLKEIQKQAADFNPTKPRSIVEAVKLESRLRLGNAKLAAQHGDLKTAMAEFRSAAQTWPGNPELDMAQLGFFNSQDSRNQLVQEFDRLFEARNYRAIFDKQLSLATAIVGDNLRIDQMKVALEKVKVAEMAIEKANLFRRNNNSYGAWEALETAAKDWPEDPSLNRMRAEVSAESAEFVHQLKKGQDAERARNIGYGLACYLNAQRLYPSSEMAREAVERLSAQILKKEPEAKKPL